MMPAAKERISYILGIDTGGTYTDTVIMNAIDKNIICTSKALTTKEDLKAGIANSIDNLDFDDFADIGLISLSTTLATNAIVEGKGCRTGLILLGSKLDKNTPADKCYFVKGKVDIKGVSIEGIDKKEIENIARKLCHEVEAIAISCYASVRNPKLEISIKDIIKDTIDMPVFCAHELTGSLGFFERTVTSILNASLVKIIDDFIFSTKIVLKEKQIYAPMMVVKGDGSLMHENVALTKPIETILSGPAASTIGASHLTEIKNAFIIDVGGTTSDMINIDNGTVKVKADGADVGGWLTKVKAANVCTFGLGGDSLIISDKRGQITVGPEKVEPLCVSALRSSSIKAELLKMHKKPTDAYPVFYRHGKISEDMIISEPQKKILKVLADKPLTKNSIRLHTRLNDAVVQRSLKNLIKNFGVIKCSITPTDILHVQNKYNEFDTEAAALGIKIASEYRGTSPALFVDEACEEIYKQLYLYCLQSAALFEENDIDFSDDPASMYVIDKAFHDDHNDFLHINFKLKKPIIGVGAPACAWLPEVARKLGTDIVIPEFAEVTSAVGAALGQVKQILSATIRPGSREDEFILYMSSKKVILNDKDEAIQYAISDLTRTVKESTKSAGGENIQITTNVIPVNIQSFNSNKKTFIETRVEVYAVATPKIIDNNSK